ncbi:MAG: hypothetical protein ABIT07_05240 [Ferruginibacter sp.]
MISLFEDTMLDADVSVFFDDTEDLPMAINFSNIPSVRPAALVMESIFKFLSSNMFMDVRGAEKDW